MHSLPVLLLHRLLWQRENFIVHCHLLVIATTKHDYINASCLLDHTSLHLPLWSPCLAFHSSPGTILISQKKVSAQMLYSYFKIHMVHINTHHPNNAHIKTGTHIYMNMQMFLLKCFFIEARPSAKMQAARDCTPTSCHWEGAVLLPHLHQDYGLDRPISHGLNFQLLPPGINTNLRKRSNWFLPHLPLSAVKCASGPGPRLLPL